MKYIVLVVSLPSGDCHRGGRTVWQMVLGVASASGISEQKKDRTHRHLLLNALQEAQVAVS